MQYLLTFSIFILFIILGSLEKGKPNFNDNGGCLESDDQTNEYDFNAGICITEASVPTF